MRELRQHERLQLTKQQDDRQAAAQVVRRLSSCQTYGIDPPRVSAAAYARP